MMLASGTMRSPGGLNTVADLGPYFLVRISKVSIGVFSPNAFGGDHLDLAFNDRQHRRCEGTAPDSDRVKPAALSAAPNLPPLSASPQIPVNGDLAATA